MAGLPTFTTSGMRTIFRRIRLCLCRQFGERPELVGVGEIGVAEFGFEVAKYACLIVFWNSVE